MPKKQLVYSLLAIIAVIVIFAAALLWPKTMNDPNIIRGFNVNSALSSAMGRIVFAKDAQNIYSVALDGTDLRQLTSGAHVSDPCLSSDGSKICFLKRRSFDTYDCNELVVINADGTNEKVICPYEEGVLNLYPSFSPDGKKIVFLRPSPRSSSINARFDRNSKVCVIGIDGSNLQDYATALSNPKYSPDGKTIYGFIRHTVVMDPPVLVSAIDIATKKNSTVGRIMLKADEIKYSPDCRHIVFTGFDSMDKNGAYQYEIYTADLNGTNVKKLTQDGGPNLEPTFTADGSQIIFLHWQQKIYIKRMNTDGTNVRTVYEW
jgi:Tol biopolymer transport system component